MDNQNNLSKCVICGNKDFIFVLKARDYSFSCPTEFSFMKCIRCGQVSVEPKPHGQYTHAKISCKKLGRVETWHFLHPDRTKIIGKLRKKGKILDIGCGLGEFLFDMKKYGWEVFGNDVLPDACTYAKKEFKLENVYNHDLLSLDFPDKSFDVVTLWHVLGYLPRPLDTLRKINRILKDDGIVVIESPNFESFQRKLFKEKWYGLGLPGHHHQFSPRSLERVLRLAGFKIIKKDYFVNLRINMISFKRSLLRVLHLERIPDEKGNNESAFLRWMKKYKLIFIFEILCFLISFLLALVNCKTCFRVYSNKIQNADSVKHAPKSMLIREQRLH